MGVPGSGRRPKPTDLHDREGTYRKDRHGDAKTPLPTGGRPEMPDGLDEVEQKEWARLIWAFEDMGMLHRVDVHAIQQYCHLYAETESVALERAETRAGVRILEENIRGMEGADLVQVFTEIVALRKLISKCTDQLRQGRMAMRQYLVEFGLTPASRGRIKLPVESEPQDEFAAFQLSRVK